jgi:carbon-monoxide dehydrogenase medium subunit
MLEVLSRRALRTLGKSEERSCWPSAPVALWSTPSAGDVPSGDGFAASHEDASPIVATVNGRRCEAPGSPGTSLLAWLRDGLGLTGCKDGCGEGVCGACTVLLDGLAVAACLVPAPRAHGAEIVTVEGLAGGDGPSALQRSFVDAGAIQCGFCTPGFLVAGTTLLAERPRPSREDIEAALAGNLCRCTGYRAIAQAIQSAADIRGDRAL